MNQQSNQAALDPKIDRYDLKAAAFSLVPSDLEAERTILGCLLADPDCDVNLDAEHFNDCDHQRIYTQIQSMKVEGEPLTFPNLLGRLVREKIGVMRDDLNRIQARADVLPVCAARDQLSIPGVARGCASGSKKRLANGTSTCSATTSPSSSPPSCLPRRSCPSRSSPCASSTARVFWRTSAR